MGLFPNIETAPRPRGRGRTSLRHGCPHIRSPLALPIAAYALPGLRPLGLFLTVLRAVRRQRARETLLGDRVLAPRADEPDRPGGDLPGVAGHTPHGPRRGMALDAHPLGLPPVPMSPAAGAASPSWRSRGDAVWSERRAGAAERVSSRHGSSALAPRAPPPSTPAMPPSLLRSLSQLTTTPEGAQVLARPPGPGRSAGPTGGARQ